jgi:polysaccharide chain length determinant protein (PEP-CTERM system associated)
MQPEVSSFTPERIVGIIIKWRWLIIVPLSTTLAVGIYLAVTLPKVYRSETLILVQQQKVPSDFIQAVVSSTIEERISTISQQIMSRSNLEKVIDQFKLFSGPKNKDMYLEDKIANLRERIVVNVTRGDARGREADSFAISFKGQNPEKVKRIANMLATYFIDENLKVREAQAIGTSDFLDAELRTKRKTLEQLETALKDYREKNLGALPEQLETNLRILERLQSVLNEKTLALRESKQQLISLEDRLSHEKKARKAISLSGKNSNGEQSQNPEFLRLQLKELQAKYTDRHPDVSKLKRKIARLEQEAAPAEIVNKGRKRSAEESRQAWQSQGDYLLISQIQDNRNNIARLKTDIKAMQAKMQFYQKRVEETPRKEQELLSLKRDYQNMSNSYSSLFERKLEAELAVNMEKKQKGEQFYIIDSARVSTKPIEPNMRKLFFFSILIGLGIGGGIIFLLEYLDNSFKSTDEIEQVLNLPVLAVIPAIVTPRGRMLKRINVAASLMALAVTGCLALGLSALSFLPASGSMQLIDRIVKLYSQIF